jgi:hypothetical protein
MSHSLFSFRVARFLFGSAVSALLITSCTKDHDAKQDDKVVLFEASGDITPKLEAFRQILGGQLNTTPGAVGGRREIDWDGIPAELLGKTLPPDFFNQVGPGASVVRQRGITYAASADIRVSANNFKEIDEAASGQFSAFSGRNTFANISSNLWDVAFAVPGEHTIATVKGFGMVFSDVDLPNSTFLEFFNDDKSLGKFFVPPHDASSSISFLGVYFKEDKVSRVEVGHQGRLSDGQKDITDGGTNDLIVLDNVLYDEPVKE